MKSMQAQARRATLKLALSGMLGLVLAGPARADIFSPPEGSVAIHYNRTAGDYGGWGLHSWESFEKIENLQVAGPSEKSDMPLEGISWGAPMKPSGKDDYGIYWVIKISEFRNQKVNFIVHKGDSKEGCGRDKYWLAPQSPAVFVNQGDCELHFTAEEAIKARK